MYPALEPSARTTSLRRHRDRPRLPECWRHRRRPRRSGLRSHGLTAVGAAPNGDVPTAWTTRNRRPNPRTHDQGLTIVGIAPRLTVTTDPRGDLPPLAATLNNELKSDSPGGAHA